jgi:cellulose synthase/poly-beta-1,6-N-acetylglucosamine synthase-like glycosyltransferase/putative flippase GtrA
MSQLSAVLRRPANFLAGGGIIALIGMALLYAEITYLHMDLQVAFAVQLAITLALNFAYNYLVTWRDVPKTTLMPTCGKFIATRLVSQILSMAIFATLTAAAIGMHYMAANVICLALMTIVNYLTGHFYVFTDRRHLIWSSAFRGYRWIAALVSNYWRIVAGIGTYIALVLASLFLFGLYITSLTAIVLTAVIFGVIAFVELSWRLYGRRTPEATANMRFPEPTERSGQGSFSLIVPAKDEPDILWQTLVGLGRQTHPNVQIIASLIEGDEATIADAEVARAAYPDRIEIVARNYDKEMKPYQLNEALQYCTGDYIGVIDAEDSVSPDLLIAVEAAFQRTRSDIVQGGVQLMNLGEKPREWFCVHNDMEYFFWFSSRMQFQADHGFVPLGGNTVFIRRQLLEEAGGWPISLTEDCALGVKLSTTYHARVVAYYEPELATREETPDNISGLFRQRIRWCTGFGTELFGRQWWQLPTLRMRFLAGYILATPFLQAATGIFLPLTIFSMFLLSAPVPLVMLTFVPYLPILLTLLLQLVGLWEFGQMYQQKVKVRHFAFLICGIFPYQIVLAAAAICAVWKIATGNTTWWKTPHSNKHRSHLATLPLPAVEEVV